MALSILGFIAVIIYIGYSVTQGMCGDNVIGKYISPDTRHTINYFVRDCGATTGFVDNVEIDNTLIFRGEAKDGSYPTLKVTWINDDTISILVATSTTDLRIYREPTVHYKDINIQYDRKIIDSYQKWRMGVR